MRRAELALLALLLAAAPVFSGASRDDLHLRARLLLREIRSQAASPNKDAAARLRAQLSALKAEAGSGADDKVAARLREAEADLGLMDSDQPLPPPPPDDVTDGDLPDRDAVAQPASPARLPPPVMSGAAPAAMPETANPIFDGTGRHPSLGAPPVGEPPEAPTADLDEYLKMVDDDSRLEFLRTSSVGLLDKFGEKDPDGSRARMLAGNVHIYLGDHPSRPNFLSIHVRAESDRMLHLIYRVSDGGAVDEPMDTIDNWTKPHKGHTGRKFPKKKKKSGGGGGSGDADGDDDGGGGGGHKGHKHGGHKKHGGGGGDGGGGGGDDDGGGGGGGGGGGKSSHHAKAPHVKGGGSAFDGGGDDGGGDSSAEASLPGSSGGGKHGRGGRGHGRKGRGDAASGDGEGGGSGSGGDSSGGGRHASAGGSMSAGNESGGGGGSRGRRGASVPLPRDFTSRGGGSALEGEEGGGRHGGRGHGGGAEDGGGLGMGSLGKKYPFHHEVPAPSAAPQSVFAAAPARAPGASVAAAAPAAPALNSPVSADEELHDAVAGNAVMTRPPLAALPRAPAPARHEAPEGPDASWPFLAFGAGAGALGLGLYLRRRYAARS